MTDRKILKRIVKIGILLLILSYLLIGCDNSEYQEISSKVIKGKISSIQHIDNDFNTDFRIYVQDSISTTSVLLNYRYNSLYKVGDSCTLIIKTIEKVK